MTASVLSQRQAGRVQGVLLMAGSCLPVLGAVLIAPVLPKMQQHFAATPGAAALVPVALTVPALALGLLAPFAGVIVDRLGRKRLLVWATVVYAVLGTAPLWLSSLEAIVASRALVGIVEAAIMTCCTTLIGDYYSGPARDRYLALQTICASASATAFFILGGVLGGSGWRGPFWAYAVSLLIAPLMAALLPATSAAEQDRGGTSHTRMPWRTMALPCLLTTFGAIVFYTVPVEMSYLLDDLGVTSTSVIGLATAVASLATVAGAAAFPRLSGRVPALLTLEFLICGAGFGIVCFATSVPVVVAGAVLNCVGTGLLLPTLLTRAMPLLAFEDRGRGTGLWTGAFFLGAFVCPLLLLGVKEQTGSLAYAVGVLGAASVIVGGFLVMRLRRTGERVSATVG